MIIHLCREEIDRKFSVLGRIVSAVHDLGHSVGDTWDTEALEHSLAEKVIIATKSIERSELLIAEVSGASVFSAGYEVAFALQSRKPVLMLVREGTESSSYATGIKNELVTVRTYTEYTIEKIVKDFIRDNDVRTKDLRFNFVIDRKIYNYLRLKSFKSGKTKAEVVRDLLLEDIQKSEKKGS
jgi:hypothetical protein